MKEMKTKRMKKRRKRQKKWRKKQTTRRAIPFHRLLELHHVVRQTSTAYQSRSLHQALLPDHEATHHGILALSGQIAGTKPLQLNQPQRRIRQQMHLAPGQRPRQLRMVPGTLASALEVAAVGTRAEVRTSDDKGPCSLLRLLQTHRMQHRLQPQLIVTITIGLLRRLEEEEGVGVRGEW